MTIQATPLFRRIYGRKERIIFLRGGARSSKSFSVMQMMTIWLYTGWMGDRYIPEGNFSVIRATFPALRASVLKDFVQYLFEMGIYEHIHHIKTHHEFHYGKRHVDFIAADDEQKLRGRKHTFAWLEEINDMDYDVFTQVIIRLEEQMFMTVNPSGFPWGKTEIEDKRMPNVGDVYLDVSTYHDNPFLPQSIKDEIEGLKYLDKDLYNIYSLGEWTKMKGLIYPEYGLYKEAPEGKVCWGLDFGFSHPMGVVKVTIANGCIYAEEKFYERERLTSDLLTVLPKGVRIIGDSARPEAIAELKKHGFQVKSSKKGPDSVKHGIMVVKLHNLFIHEDSINLQRELQRYKWAESKDGDNKEEPVKAWDDLLDAMRYAVHFLYGKRKIEFLTQ